VPDQGLQPSAQGHAKYEMNYLAHLFLTRDMQEARLGGLLGDFEKGNIKGKYPKAIETEIELHRKIDRFTDNHSIIQAAKRVATEEKRRYMGIVLDVFYDHLLAKNWKTYSDQELAEFTQHTYQMLLNNREFLPDKLNEIIPQMIEQDWLMSYQDFGGFESAIRRISNRLSRGEVLLGCVTDIENNFGYLSSGFEEFFPQLMDYVDQERVILSA
jgi:acyl carrier protein phosphodiesterase